MTRGMILAASALMVCNIVRYYHFERDLRKIESWKKEQRILLLPLFLLIFFLLGYLGVAVLGHPDMLIAGILFGGSVFVFIMVNFTCYVAKHMQEQDVLEQELELSRRASEAKTTFLSNMSHDIRTPMNAIIGFTDLALQSRDLTEIHDYLGKIQLSGEHLLSLINDILEMSRIESGKVELDEKEADLCLTVSEMKDLFDIQMESKDIRFDVDTAGIHDRWVICDQNRLRRILANLISNACKFTPEGGEVSVSAKQVETEGDRSVYQFRVRDTGIGMTEEFAGKIFDAFERERTSTVSGIQGTGLGMAITKHLVELMDGTIRVDTAPGKGTEITVTIPFRHAGEQGAAEECGCHDQARETFRGRNILLVEDIELNRQLASAILANYELSVETAENGEVAVRKVAEAAPGYYLAVLMDVQMPVMDGYEATQRIRSLEDPERAQIPIIAMTANAFTEDVKKAHDAGMDGHIAKPIEPMVMMSTLYRVLNEKK